MCAVAEVAKSKSPPREEVIVCGAVALTEWCDKVEAMFANVETRVISEKRAAATIAEKGSHSLPGQRRLSDTRHELRE